ncbi:RICIN domain-containing protein [Massilia sp. W12]|uniref:RICIN domain-containing protein n=1 Tax=Massilia sp. W12 TaxID=3126507 RepID=UPI0030D15A8A
MSHRLLTSASSGRFCGLSILTLGICAYFPLAAQAAAPAAGMLLSLINPLSNKALDVAGASTSDGANVQIWSSNGSGAQQWKLSANSNGSYTLINPNSGKALDVAGARTADGTNVQIATVNGSGAQQWQFRANADGSYTLINTLSGKALDVAGARTADGTNVQIASLNGSGAQRWRLQEVGNSAWRLVWSDEFNGPAIDGNKWSFEVNGKGGGNNELQYYTARSQNARIENGKLVIEARKEQYSGADGVRQYTSARLRSLNKGDWLYGRFEARMKLPRGQGMWPAFWMLPTDNKYGTWAASGEIDIMEAVNMQAAGGNKVYGSIHFGNTWPNNKHITVANTPPSSISDNFHVYAVEWEPRVIRWYVNNVLYSTQTQWNTGSAPYPAPFDQRFHLLLNLAVGGNWPGSPNASTVFPQRMEVDYVRVYQK